MAMEWLECFNGGCFGCPDEERCQGLLSRNSAVANFILRRHQFETSHFNNMAEPPVDVDIPRLNPSRGHFEGA
jgi:hypothetical protein